MTRLLGIDLGTRRIGLAVADTAAGADVRPLATIARSTPERDAGKIGSWVREQRIDEIVVGLPLNMDGSQGAMVEATRDWVAAALVPLGVPVCLRDERRTSEQAERRLAAPRRGPGGGPPSRSQRNTHRAALDREAAANILQAELDARLGVV